MLVLDGDIFDCIKGCMGLLVGCGGDDTFSKLQNRDLWRPDMEHFFILQLVIMIGGRAVVIWYNSSSFVVVGIRA